MLPVVFDGASNFLGSSHFKEGLKNDVKYKDRKSLPDLIWNSNDWRKRAFGVKIIAKKKVSFFLSATCH